MTGGSDQLRGYRRVLQCAALLLLTVLFTASGAHAGKKDDNPFPDADDPSAFTGPFVDDVPEGLPEANEGAFDGGNTGTGADAAETNSVAEEDQRDDGRFNVPTNGPPSPLYGADPFTQQMLRFEEFGPEKLDFKKTKAPKHWQPLPAPADAQSAPDGAALDGFLAQRIWPLPTKFANDQDSNPWQAPIEAWLGRPLDDPPAEGRPPGLGWSHQRWDEFKPKVYFNTAMAGSRVNGGLRDGKQDHGYAAGEFGPGGLYHNTAGVPWLRRNHRGNPDQVPPRYARAGSRGALDLRRHLAAQAAQGPLRRADPDAPLQRAADRRRQEHQARRLVAASKHRSHELEARSIAPLKRVDPDESGPRSASARIRSSTARRMTSGRSPGSSTPGRVVDGARIGANPR